MWLLFVSGLHYGGASCVKIKVRDYAVWTNNFRHAEKILFVKQNLPPHHPCSWGTISRWIEYQPKSNEKCTHFLATLPTHCTLYFIHFLKVILAQKSFILAVTSGDIIFHKILELHSTLSDERKIFATNFPFSTEPKFFDDAPYIWSHYL